MSPQAHHLRRLATLLAAGPMADREALLARASPFVGDLKKARWLASLTRELSVEFATGPRPTLRRLTARIRTHQGFLKAWAAGRGRISSGPVTPQMAPAAGAPQTWEIPEITTLGDLATALRLHPDDLRWLISSLPADHYRHRWQVKPRSGRFRLIESPKLLLKCTQRQVLRKILGFIPPHDAAQGFRTGCSIRDFVAPHTGQEILLRMDLEDFFPSITAARVLQVFLTSGYPEPVARALTRLTTHAASPTVLAAQALSGPERQRLAQPHLPQGAPTSPALANLCTHRLDCRLAGLARAAGAHYTRYADDLLFSGGPAFARQSSRFLRTVTAIIIEQGFRPNHRKTRTLRQGQQQHAAGLVLNVKPNLDRRQFDLLKAILTNCARHGPTSQNRENHPQFAAHLEGKLAWVHFIHPGKATKLRAIFAQIDWHR